MENSDRLDEFIERRRRQLKFAEAMKKRREDAYWEHVSRRYEQLYGNLVYKKLSSFHFKVLSLLPQVGFHYDEHDEFLRSCGGRIFDDYIRELQEKMFQRTMTETEYKYILETPFEAMKKRFWEQAEALYKERQRAKENER